MVIVFGFVLGVVAVLAVEAVGVVLLMRWLNRKTEKEERKLNSSATPTIPDTSFICNKQGFVWILESTKIPKGWPFDKVAKEQRPKNEFLEVTPVRKHAKIKDQCLVLIEPDGSQTKIPLKGCKIEAVSASSLPSRKWAKRFPVKVERKQSEIYDGCKLLFVYLETAWEKESWCKALRLASCDDKEKCNWVTKLSIDFHNYVNSLNTEYPSFIKPSMVSADPGDRSLRNDGSSSKVKQFLKRLAKKGSRRDAEVKTSSKSMPSSEERKMTVRSYSYGDSARSERMLPPTKPYNAEGNKLSSSSSFVTTGSEGQLSTIYDKDSDDKIFSDEGTLCWNLLISRLFFDAKNNSQMKTALQSRIQRTLSNMRSPSYIGEITCTSTDTGNVPPHIHGMRVIASNMDEVWAFEVDIEYAGGAVLDVETRLEVGELDAQEGEELNNKSMGEVTSDLLEGIEYCGKKLNISEDAAAHMEQKHEIDPKSDDSRRCKMVTRVSSQVPKWKSMLQSVAKHVSQVPLALGIKVTSLRGTVRLYIKPPPSDQIWFAFTTMPEVDFSLESSVGDHKVTSAHLAVFLISRFKAAIRDTLVLPNCENVYIPWMIAEKDDWVPRKVAPFMWINQDSGDADSTTKEEVPGSRLGNVVNEVVNNTAKQELPGSQPGNLIGKIDEAPSASQDVKHDESAKVGYSDAHKRSESSESCSHSAPTPLSSSNDHLPDDSSTVSSENDQSLDKSPSISSSHGTVESCVTSRSVSFSDGPPRSMDNEDTRPQRLGTKARMLGFRKKVGEKLEERRRNLEEKGKTIVEKIKESKLSN